MAADNKFTLTRADELDARRAAKADATHIRPGGTKVVQVVYYLHDTASDEIKIGSTNDLKRRLVVYRESNRHLELIGQEDGGPELKRERHRQFKSFWIERDWFKLHSVIIQHIQDLARISSSLKMAQVVTSNVEVARRFLLQQLENGIKPLEDIRNAARVAGINWRAVERAKHDLAVRTVKDSSFPAKVIGWMFREEPVGR